MLAQELANETRIRDWFVLSVLHGVIVRDVGQPFNRTSPQRRPTDCVSRSARLGMALVSAMIVLYCAPGIE